MCREWSDLTPEQAGYLVQVRPPGDTLNDIVRDLAQLANITNAAILHDDSFGRRTLKIFVFFLYNVHKAMQKCNFDENYGFYWKIMYFLRETAFCAW